MAKKKYYAVRRGKKPGVYDTWEECQEQVSGYTGALFKSFLTRKEAESFFRGQDSVKDEILSKLTPDCPIAFTDGSYEHKLKRYGYGVLILRDSGEGEPEEIEICGCGNNPAYLESRNIPGEAMGVLKALQWAVNNGYAQIRICYDYAGLEKWATGQWKTNKPVAQAYAETYREKFAPRIRVHFEKVKGHSNNPFNDRADSLAKKGLTEGGKI